MYKMTHTTCISILAFLLDAKDFIKAPKVSDSVLKEKKHFKSERAAEEYMGIED